MSTLDSSSTTAEIIAAYMDNMSYAEDDSAAKARAFITACRGILVKRPKRAQHGGEMIEMNLELIKQELDAAKQWVSTAGADDGGVIHRSVEDFRS